MTAAEIVLFCPGGGQSRSYGGGGIGGVSVLKDGTVLCPFFQQNQCRQQSSDHCVRPAGLRKHLCAARKSDGNFCAGKHSRKDHK